MLGDAVAHNPGLLGSEAQITTLYDLSISVFSSQSLLVSIPILHSLSKTLKSHQPALVKVLNQALGTLLKICSERLLKYESLLKGSEHPVIMFLEEDFETLPEQHAFLGNYRRYCVSIIEHITQTNPTEALQHILGQTTESIQAVSQMHLVPYTKDAVPILQLEAQHGVVKSALSGFSHWVNQKTARSPSTSPDPGVERTRAEIYQSLGTWCQSLMSLPTLHPDAARVIIQLLVEVVCRIDNPQGSLVWHIVSYSLEMRLPEKPSDSAYADAVRLFSLSRVADVQLLARMFPDHLFVSPKSATCKVGWTNAAQDHYHDLDGLVNRTLNDPRLEDRTQWALSAVLLIVM